MATLPSVTLFPRHIVTLFPVVAVGGGFTVTITFEVALPHAFVMVNEYVPGVVTVMVGVVAPVLQVPPPVFPESITLPPLQNVRGPFAVITGLTGGWLNVTTIMFEVTLPHALVFVTE
jgi:hypothetical protein